MKIGIITFWQTLDNYGQILQCFALQTILRKIGHSPFLIRYTHSQVKFTNWRKIKKNGLKTVTALFNRGITNNPNIKDQNKNLDERRFIDFKNSYLTQSKQVYHSIKELRKCPPQAECYIAGSDQIWAKSLSFDENKAFFLDFGSKSILRISYAASFAMNEYPKKERNKLKRCLEKFNSVSVREVPGIEICKSVGINAKLVLDPTLLLQATDYVNTFHFKIRERQGVFIYSLNISNPNEICWEEIRTYANKQNLPITITSSSGYISAEKLFGEKMDYFPAQIPEWLKIIGSSKLVVTTSFHGIVFCILFHTNFIYFPLKGSFSRGNNRVLGLLKDLNLNNKVYTDCSSVDEIIKTPINWPNVDKCLQIRRNESIKYLISALKHRDDGKKL